MYDTGMLPECRTSQWRAEEPRQGGPGLGRSGAGGAR